MTSWQLKLAVKTINAGGVIAYPTESVYGLGCDASNLSAVARLLSIKKRSYQKGLIILVSHIEQALPLLDDLNATQAAQISQPSKRATTWLIEKQYGVSPLLSGTHAKLAVRVTEHPVAKSLCEMLGRPIISTSCNHHAKATSSQVLMIRNKHTLELDYILGGSCGGEAPSRIVDLDSGAVIRK